MPVEVWDLRQRVERLQGQRIQLKSRQLMLQREAKQAKLRGRALERALGVVQAAAETTQRALEDQVGGVVSMALAAVFPNPYTMHLTFGTARGRPEARITFSRDGYEGIDPLDETGGGVVDVTSLALRVAVWRMGQARPVLALDEPTKHVAAELQPRVAEMLHELSLKLSLQFIVVTHSEELAEGADRVLRVTKRRGRSRVEGGTI